MTTARLSFDELMERRIDARIRRDDRQAEKIAKREDKAERMIGELVRNGETVHYIFPEGGKYREGTKADLIAFLLRNHYA